SDSGSSRCSSIVVDGDDVTAVTEGPSLRRPLVVDPTISEKESGFIFALPPHSYTNPRSARRLTSFYTLLTKAPRIRSISSTRPSIRSPSGVYPCPRLSQLLRLQAQYLPQRSSFSLPARNCRAPPTRDNRR